jgi:hypothetical protein
MMFREATPLPFLSPRPGAYSKSDQHYMFSRVREKFYIQIPRSRIDELLFQEPTTKISAPNSKYNCFFGQKPEQGFHRFKGKIKKLLISLNSKGMFDQITLKCRLFKCYKHRLE